MHVPPTVKKASIIRRPAKQQVRRRARVPSQTSTKSEREVWALLLNTNERALMLATRKLDRIVVDGVRHFSAVHRTVPLHLVDQAAREIHALERAVDPSEVAFDRPTRKWTRKAARVTESADG